MFLTPHCSLAKSYQDGNHVPIVAYSLDSAPMHSSEVPLVLNLQTCSISTQYHVVFDGQFSTVELIVKDKNPPDHWDDLCLENTMYIYNNANVDTPLHLQYDWLVSMEQEHKQQEPCMKSCIRVWTLQLTGNRGKVDTKIYSSQHYYSCIQYMNIAKDYLLLRLVIVHADST
jgi:hypothetical protein